MNNLYKCPNCSSLLQQADNGYFCINKHRFDIAKEGYVNLLLPNQKGSKSPGDDKGMLQARREFLEKGHYDKLVNEVVAIINENLHENILDIGCGEGYYSNKIRTACEPRSLYGLDISKDAVKMAAKKYLPLQLAVASAVHLPYQDNAFDLAFCIFSPFDIKETLRVLDDQGILIVVGPNLMHLQELARIIYGDVVKHHMEAVADSGLKLIQQKSLQYQLALSASDVVNLWKMSPYYWHTKQGAELVIKTIDRVTVDFRIDVYQKQII